MIVTCPNCGTRFRLGEDAAAAVTAGRRMKCAECGERWQPAAAEATAAPPLRDEDDELAAATAELRGDRPAEPVSAMPSLATPLPPAPGVATISTDALSDSRQAADPEPEPAFAAEAEDEAEPPRRWPILKTLVALVLGAAFAVAAAGLWVGKVDLSRLPPPLDRFAAAFAVAAPSPLAIAVEGHVTVLSPGERLLEVTGTVSNPGAERVTVPMLRASLAGPQGVVRRWTIAPPADALGPGASAAFASTITGVPADATALSVTAGR